MNLMTYNDIIIPYINPIERLMMVICIVCESSFIKLAREVACSKKCKIIAGSKKQEDGCWIYKKSCSGAYGKLRWRSKWYSAHRVAFEEFNGPIPTDKWVCHKCDTPKCVNPEHLFLGSASENRRDAVTKKRAAIGERNPLARFTDRQIEEMRKLHNEGITYERLSNIFNCSYLHVFNVINNLVRKEKNGV